MRRHDKWIGNSHNLIFRSPDAGDKRSFFDDISGGIIQFDPVAHLERTHISNHQSGNNITDNRTWSERNDQSDKYRNPLEHTGIGARKIRINHRNHKCIEQETGDMESRHRPVRIEAVDFESSCFHFTCQIQDETYQILHGIPDDDDGKQFGHIIDNTHKDTANRIPYIAQQLICQSFCLREDDKNQRYGKQ